MRVEVEGLDLRGQGVGKCDYDLAAVKRASRLLGDEFGVLFRARDRRGFEICDATWVKDLGLRTSLSHGCPLARSSSRTRLPD